MNCDLADFVNSSMKKIKLIYLIYNYVLHKILINEFMQQFNSFTCHIISYSYFKKGCHS